MYVISSDEKTFIFRHYGLLFCSLLYISVPDHIWLLPTKSRNNTFYLLMVATTIQCRLKISICFNCHNGCHTDVTSPRVVLQILMRSPRSADWINIFLLCERNTQLTLSRWMPYYGVVNGHVKHTTMYVAPRKHFFNISEGNLVSICILDTNSSVRIMNK